MDEWTSFIKKQVSHPFCLCVCVCVRDEVCAKSNTKLKSAQQQCCKTVQMGQRYVGAPVRASSFATITFLFVSRANRVQSHFFCLHFHSVHPHPHTHHSRSFCLYHTHTCHPLLSYHWHCGKDKTCTPHFLLAIHKTAQCMFYFCVFVHLVGRSVGAFHLILNSPALYIYSDSLSLFCWPKR